jgi:hypothetical protein
MGAYVEQLECLNCSQSRSFVLHGDRERRLVGQIEAARMARRAVLTCARCGSSSLIRGWTDALPYATSGRTRRRRVTRPTNVAQDG